MSFDKEVVHVFAREHDPFERKNLAPDRIPDDAKQMLDTLREYMLASPEVNKEVDLKKMPQSLIDDLRSLGYVQ